MGWTFYDVPPYNERAEILRIFTGPNLEVQKLNRHGSTWFAAVKTGAIIWCAVILTKRDQGQWGYKDMSEDMGPALCYCKCPNSILKLLSPSDRAYTNQFRERSRAWNNRIRPKPGDTIKTPKPLEFTNGTYDTFTKMARGRGVYRTPSGSLVRLTGFDLLGATK